MQYAQQGQEPLIDQNAAGPIFLHMGDKDQGIKTPSPEYRRAAKASPWCFLPIMS